MHVKVPSRILPWRLPLSGNVAAVVAEGREEVGIVDAVAQAVAASGVDAASAGSGGLWLGP